MQLAYNGKYSHGYSSFVVPIAENLQTSHMCIIEQISNFVHRAR